MDTTYATVLPVLVHNAVGTGSAFARLEYDHDNSNEVRIMFGADESMSPSFASWTFGRDLLRDGLDHKVDNRAGEGDVKCSLSDGETGYLILLSSPDGQAEILFPLGDIKLFVTATDNLFPQRDLTDEELDAELAALLDGEL